MSVRSSAARGLRKVARTIDPPTPAKPEADSVPTVKKPKPAVARPRALTGAMSDSTPGSCRASMFFEQHPRFYETSETSAYRGRLNLRYEAIFAQNRDILQGARVMDIASHDGRWSLAALATGAASVVGIEARPDLVQHAGENLAAYGYDADRYEFVQGDVFEAFATRTFDVDVVLCLGFLYHTLRYNELFDGIAKAKPKHVIIDTISYSKRHNAPIVDVLQERIERQGNAVADSYSHGDKVLIGRPNLRAIRVMMSHYGYRVDRLSDWAGLLRDNPEADGVGDYRMQHRFTVRCTHESLLSED